MGDPTPAPAATAASVSTTPSSLAYAAPEHADRALLILHGAGTHAALTSLDEMLNPTLNRLRYHGNLVSAKRFATGDATQPGGVFEGLLVEYVYRSARCSRDEHERYASPPLMPDGFLDSVKEPQRLLVLEGRWDSSFLSPGYREVSSWAGHHVGRMMFELFLYHLRSPIDLLSAVAIICLFFLGGWKADSDRTVFWLLIIGGIVVFAVSLVEAVSSWWDRGKVETLSCRPEDRTQLTPANTHPFWSVVAPALSLSIYQIQRAFVLLVSLFAVFFLPLLAPVVRTLATVPGLNWISRNTLALLETFALAGAATDVESISNNPVASAAIQTRLRSALAEVEARLDADSPIVVLGHSAGAPLAFWLLSEPDIHRRQRQKPLRYRLITVGGALNWAKRGMECEATPLDRPLVNSLSERLVKIGSKRAGEKTYWLDCYSSWDPTPHGGVRRKEYEGSWQTWSTDSQPDAAWAAPYRRVAAVLNRLRRNWWRSQYNDRQIADEQEVAKTGETAGLAETPDNQKAATVPEVASETMVERPDPTMLVRNLGSPISAEHSEYFRNQQEFVPALVRAIDEKIEWAQHETEPARKRQWENARIALLSGLVRARIAMFVVPVAALVSALFAERYLITSCEEHRSDETWWLLEQIGEGMSWLFANIPFFGDQTEGVCNNVVFEQLAIAGIIALISYALVEVYTNFCWASLGRSREPLDEGPKRVKRKISLWQLAFSPRQWFLADIRAWRLILVWLPTFFPPFLFLFVFPVVDYWYTWLLLVSVNLLMIPLEISWYSRCIRAAPEAMVAYGRSHDSADVRQRKLARRQGGEGISP